MKHKFSFRFPAARPNWRPRGQYLAAAALMLALAVVGTASVSLSVSQPQVLAVQPETVSYKSEETREQAADAGRPEGVQPIAEQEVPAQPGPALPAEGSETPVAEPELPSDAAGQPATETETPAANPEAPAQPGSGETAQPATGAETPDADPAQPTDAAGQPATEAETPAANPESAVTPPQLEIPAQPSDEAGRPDTEAETPVANPESAVTPPQPEIPAQPTDAAGQPATEAETPAANPEGAVTPPQPETPVQPSANPESSATPAQPAAPAAVATLMQSTPELAAEDQEAQVRQEELESTNSQPAVPPVAPPPEGVEAVAGPDGEIVLLTPEQLGSIGIGPEDEAALGEENCLAWLLEYFFGIGRSGWHKSFGNTYYYDPQTHERATGVRVIDGKLHWFNSHGILQEDATFGVDVSRYQQDVNWRKLKKAGVEFAILRIGYRGYETGAMVLDPMYETHMANASKAGLRTGVYFFSQAINEAEAVEEAEAILYVLDVLGHSVQYPVYFDSEYATSSHKGRADGLTREERTACAVAFCERIQQAGLRAGVYASTNWFRDKLDYNTVSRYSIWNAHYGVAESPIGCEIWQSTGTGTLDGVKGQIDINVSYIG